MKKLSVVVPYRNREEHLAKFIPFMEKELAGKKFIPSISIVEQIDDKPFNRAKLLNVGFAENKDCDYFAFHDVDMLPLKSDYSYVDSPTHLATEAEQFGWKLPYDGYFGGVTLFDKSSFEKINGYANEYWGWGAEDDDAMIRCQFLGVPVFRKQGRYQSLSHERHIENNAYNANLTKLNFFAANPSHQKIMKDGLSTLQYEKISEEKIGDFSRMIKVKL